MCSITFNSFVGSNSSNCAGLPVHIHASFALQDNRRGFWRHADDTDGKHRIWANWNEHIIEKVIPEIYADALKQHVVFCLRYMWGTACNSTYQDALSCYCVRTVYGRIV